MWESSRPQQPLFPSSTASTAAPKAIGRFRCEERLGVDGPLETYRARVAGLGGFDRLFSLTCLAPGAVARRPSAAEGLLRAARATMTLKDSRIAAVAESGLTPGSAFVASEFVHGVSLQELAEHLVSSTSPRALPPAIWGAIIAALGAEIAGALAVAHAAATPVVHGALGPSNVMVTPQGAVKLLDFGLLAAVAAPMEITLVPGRAHLMAPERRPGAAPTGQVAAAAVLDRPADIFALGAMLDRLTAIETPEAPPTIGVFGPSRPMPINLRPLLRSMMAPAPTQRPAPTEVESGFRQIAREARGVDVALELGTLVRLIMQLRPAAVESSTSAPGASLRSSSTLEGAHEAIDADDSRRAPAVGAGGLGRIPDQPFTDEPTAILDVSADGKPSSLAAILLELRATESEEGGHQTPTDVPQTSFSDLAGSYASAHEVATRVVFPVAANRKEAPVTGSAIEASIGQIGLGFDLPANSDAQLTGVPAPMVQMNLTPSAGIAAEPPPAPEEAVMDEGIEAGELPPSALSLEATETVTSSEAIEPTMATIEAPSLEELIPRNLQSSRPLIARAGQDRRSGTSGVPNSELFDLTSGEIAASLPDLREFHPAGAPMPAPASVVRSGAITSSDQDVNGGALPPAAPEPIFAEFSAAMPVLRPSSDMKRATVTPPHWQPGNVDGPEDRRANGPAATHRPSRSLRAIAVAAVAVLSAVAIALLARG
jgi:serine/threonine protein kinase